MHALRLIRFAKFATLLAGVLTFIDVVVILGWQGFIFFSEGDWRFVPISFLLNPIHQPRNTGNIESGLLADVMERFLQIPALVPLLLALALLVIFYSWLIRIEKNS